jgi:hypothetical protein
MSFSNYEIVKKYKIVRMYFSGASRVIKKGLTLDKAQAHCKNPETSSSTCKLFKNKLRTQTLGQWFDGYTTM